jgi:hypothetical protein
LFACEFAPSEKYFIFFFHYNLVTAELHLKIKLKIIQTRIKTKIPIWENKKQMSLNTFFASHPVLY